MGQGWIGLSQCFSPVKANKLAIRNEKDDLMMIIMPSFHSTSTHYSAKGMRRTMMMMIKSSHAMPRRVKMVNPMIMIPSHKVHLHQHHYLNKKSECLIK